MPTPVDPNQPKKAMTFISVFYCGREAVLIRYEDRLLNVVSKHTQFALRRVDATRVVSTRLKSVWCYDSGFHSIVDFTISGIHMFSIWS